MNCRHRRVFDEHSSFCCLVGHVRRLHPGRRIVAVVGLILRARAAADRSGKRRLAGRRPTQESAGGRFQSSGWGCRCGRE